jgi:hypothetical protein
MVLSKTVARLVRQVMEWPGRAPPRWMISSSNLNGGGGIVSPRLASLSRVMNSEHVGIEAHCASSRRSGLHTYNRHLDGFASAARFRQQP